VDKNNHSINPLEWIVMELPANPKNILQGVYNKHGMRIDIEEATYRPFVPWQFADSDNLAAADPDADYDFGGLFE
jgi:hypothetical protein